jgi:hypothetical protein
MSTFVTNTINRAIALKCFADAAMFAGNTLSPNAADCLRAEYVAQRAKVAPGEVGQFNRTIKSTLSPVAYAAIRDSSVFAGGEEPSAGEQLIPQQEAARTRYYASIRGHFVDGFKPFEGEAVTALVQGYMRSLNAPFSQEVFNATIVAALGREDLR